MIETNLSTRPFYNDKAVRLWVLVLGALVLVATFFNVSRVLYFSGSNTELVRQASQDEQRATQIRAAAAKLRNSVEVKQIEAASVEARQANDLIDRRTFSWTELFNQFEKTLPDDVRITALRPKLDFDRRIVLNITVLARSVEEVSQFMENLERTGAFGRIVPGNERFNEEGQLETVLTAEYASAGTAATKPAAPTPADKNGPKPQ